MREPLIIELPSLLISSVIEAKAIQLIERSFDTHTLIREANRDLVMPNSVAERLIRGLDEMQTHKNKVGLLTNLLHHFTNLLPQVDAGTLGDNGIRTANLSRINNTKPLIEDIIFEIVQHLEVLGINTSDTFTLNEYDKINDTLERILQDLDIVKAGNTILGDLIEELQNDLKESKSSMVLGKKPFYQRVGGIILQYGATKLADEVLVEIKPSLMELMKNGGDSLIKAIGGAE